MGLDLPVLPLAVPLAAVAPFAAGAPLAAGAPPAWERFLDTLLASGLVMHRCYSTSGSHPHSSMAVLLVVVVYTGRHSSYPLLAGLPPQFPAA